MGQPMFICGLIKQTIFTTNQREKMSKCPNSIRCQDSNPLPYGHESLPINTGPSLPRKLVFLSEEHLIKNEIIK